MELPSPIVEAGYSNLTEEGSVRFRQNNSGNEVYLGKSDLGVGANRVEAGYVWQDGSHQIVFSYDGAGNISTSVDSGAASLSYAITPSCNSGGWDTMDILVVDRSDATAVTFEDVDLNGFDLGNFGSFDVSGTPGFQNWTVTAFDFTQAWTLTGTLRIQNFAGSAELNKLQLTAGCLP